MSHAVDPLKTAGLQTVFQSLRRIKLAGKLFEANDRYRGRIWSSFLLTALVALLGTSGNAAASGLYVPNENSGTVSEFQGVLESGTTPPHRVDSSNDMTGGGPSTVAFDSKGNMWVSDFFNNSIVQFSKSQIAALKTNSAPTARIVIAEDDGDNLNGPEGIVFDANGNLWVGSELGQKILAYKPSQLTTSGNPTPNVILNASSFSFSSPSLPIFYGGNLWVVDENISNGVGGTGEIFKYSKAQISGLSTGIHNIDPVLGIGYGGSGELEGLAFDTGGNIWVADVEQSLIYKCTVNQLRRTGLFQNVTPAVILNPTAITDGSPCTLSLDSPYGVAFDGLGNLYVGNVGSTGSDCFGTWPGFRRLASKRVGTRVRKFTSARTPVVRIWMPRTI